MLTLMKLMIYSTSFGLYNNQRIIISFIMFKILAFLLRMHLCLQHMELLIINRQEVMSQTVVVKMHNLDTLYISLNTMNLIRLSLQ